MLRTLFISLALMGTGSAAQDLIIDDFAYATDAAAQAAWRPSSLNPEVTMAEGAPWGERVMLLPCPFTEDVPRAYWDREVAIELSAHQAISFQIHVPDPAAISQFTLYFHVSDGWYYHHITFPQSGWQTVRLPLSAFATSSATAPLEQIDRIRLSPWKGASVDTTLAVGDLRAYTPRILVTEGFYGNNVPEMLAELGLGHGTVTEAGLLSGALADARLLIIGYQANLSEAAWDVIDPWVAAGGRVISFHALPERLESLLGLQRVGAHVQTMHAMHFETDDIAELPAVVEQASWQFIRATTDRPDVRLLGTWEAEDGTMLSDPAWFLSDTGAWMTHVLLDDGGEPKRQMLLAIIGHFLPDAWTDLAEQAIGQIGHVGPHTEFTAAAVSIEADANLTSRPGESLAWLSSAETLRQSALASLASGEYPAVFVDADRARESLRQAYYRSQIPRWPEIRMCWESQGTGPYPGDWARTADVLADNGFTGIAPIMFTGGLAHWPSSHLPHSDKYTEWGDQIEQSLEACHDRGIEVHIRKLTWFLLWTPQDFIDTMRAAGRTQVDVKGEDVDWLCPSDPLNRALEVDVMLEAVEGYDVDGINLDYIRYPSSDCCYCDPCRTRFEAQTGNTVVNWPTDCHGDGPLANAYREWRVEQITSFLRSLRQALDASAPEVELSADVFRSYPACRASVAQDWVAWVEEGLLDFVCPMDYTDSASVFSATVEAQRNLIAGRIPMVPGIGVTSSKSTLSPDQAIRQARITRDLGAQGFILFSLYAPLAEETLPAFGLGFTKPPGEALMLR